MEASPFSNYLLKMQKEELAGTFRRGDESNEAQFHEVLYEKCQS